MRAVLSSAAVRWTLLALAGIAVAVAVGLIASQLTSQRIGLASEPLEAGEALAPARQRSPGDGQPRQGSNHTTTTTTAPSTTTNAPTTTTPPTTTTSTTDDYESDSEGGAESEDD